MFQTTVDVSHRQLCCMIYCLYSHVLPFTDTACNGGIPMVFSHFCFNIAANSACIFLKWISKVLGVCALNVQ